MASSKLIYASSAGVNEVIPAPGAGKRIRVFGFFFVLDAADTVQFRSGTTDDADHNMTGPMSFGDNGGVCNAYNPEGVFVCRDNEALNVYLTTGETCGGAVSYGIG